MISHWLKTPASRIFLLPACRSWSRRLSFIFPATTVFLLAAALGYSAAPLPTTPDKATISLAVTAFKLAEYDSIDNCPNGFNPTATETYAKFYLPADKRHLLEGDDWDLRYTAAELSKTTNICQSPEEALRQRPNYPSPYPVRGNIAFGLNLDGDIDGNSLASPLKPHTNFISPGGEAGIDNELFRVLGCGQRQQQHQVKTFAEIVRYPTTEIKTGEITILIEITDVQDRRNDDYVKVGLFTGRDSMVQDRTGHLVSHTSQTIDERQMWHNYLEGRIADSVLYTTPTDINLKYDSGPMRGSFYIRDARFQAKLLDNGELQGYVGGYTDIAAYYNPLVRGYTKFLATDGGLDCPSTFKGLYEYADAYPDENGRFTAISSAYAVRAIPAFIFHPEPSELLPVNEQDLASRRSRFWQTTDAGQ